MKSTLSHKSCKLRPSCDCYKPSAFICGFFSDDNYANVSPLQELYSHIEKGLGKNLKARCSALLLDSIEEYKAEMRGNIFDKLIFWFNNSVDAMDFCMIHLPYFSRQIVCSNYSVFALISTPQCGNHVVIKLFMLTLLFHILLRLTFGFSFVFLKSTT